MLGSYIIFTLNAEEYAIDILKSQEILQVKEIIINKVPMVNKFISGIINLRGEVIPIMSLKKRFDFSKAVEDEKIVIIVEDKKLVVGFLVDFIVEVLPVSEEEMISPTEDVKLRYEYVDSIICKEKRMIFVLNINKIIELRTEI